MSHKFRLIKLLSLFGLVGIACSVFTNPAAPTQNPTPRPTSTALLAAPVEPGEANPDEPVFVSGLIPFTSPFFLNTIAEPFVMLEDQAGFVTRDKEFEFPFAGQAIGPVEFTDDENTLSFGLALPAVPQGTFVDVDNDGEVDAGVQVFAVAYWFNTWGGPFLEPRDGRGWSTAHSSTITDQNRDDEIVGGYLIVWAPDDQQSFPTGFGPDGSLFTADDPSGPIDPGYNIVDLNEEPFRFYKEPQPTFELVEGASAVKDYSELGYTEAFDEMFNKVSREYPFTAEKAIDWEALYDDFAPRVAAANDDQDFYRAIRDFTYAIPDAHVGVSFDADVFFEERGGSFGLVLTELSDGRILVTEVLPGTAGAGAGIQVGAEILRWDGQPVDQAVDAAQSYFGPYSTPQQERSDKVIFLTRVPPGTRVEVTYQNPGDSSSEDVTLEADVEYDSLFLTLPGFNEDELSLPLEASVLDDSGLGYIRITTFSGDYNLMARLWETFISGLIENDVPGLIIDLRENGGGSGGLALDFAGYFFEEEVDLYIRSYYNERTETFEPNEIPSKITPGPLYYEGSIAVLVSPACISACEGFAYALQQSPQTVVVGHAATAGAFGDVGFGQYELPGDLSLQFPTGRPETMDGEVVIEGVGVEPNILVPITEASALGQVDAVLEAATDALR